MSLDDFEISPRRVSIHAAIYADGATTGWHSHGKGQLLSASRGLMVATTELGVWFVPFGYALWMPAGLSHEVSMRGTVAMTSAYILAGTPSLPGNCRVLQRTALLGAAIEALADEDNLNEETARSGYLAALVIDEIASIEASPLELPMPRDRRLQNMCRVLLDRPFDAMGIDGWANQIGMSRRSLTRHFRQETGLSFLQWKRRARLLLTSTKSRSRP